MQSRVACRAESEKTTAERRAEQRREQMSDESSAETRAALRGEQNRGAKAQTCRGATAKTGRVSCREKKEKTLYRERKSRAERGDRSHAHANRDAHLACV